LVSLVTVDEGERRQNGGVSGWGHL
jgi:hypothetical protein